MATSPGASGGDLGCRISGVVLPKANHGYMYMCMYVCAYVCMYACMFMIMYVCVRTRMLA